MGLGWDGVCSLGEDWMWITFIECISEYIRSIFGRIFGVTHSVAGRRSGSGVCAHLLLYKPLLTSVRRKLLLYSELSVLFLPAENTNASELRFFLLCHNFFYHYPPGLLVCFFAIR